MVLKLHRMRARGHSVKVKIYNPCGTLMTLAADALAGGAAAAWAAVAAHRATAAYERSGECLTLCDRCG